MSARLYLVRHGQTQSNVDGALDTALPGAPLTELGHEQARTVGQWLARRGVRPQTVFHSEATRARQTAGHVAEALGVPAQAVPGVHEVQAGDAEMRNDTEAILAYHHMLRQWLELGDVDARMPGGESLAQVHERALPVVDDLASSFVAEDRDAVLVIHGTLMRLLALAHGVVPAPWGMVNRIPNCGVIELDPLGARWECYRWGDLEAPFDV